MNYKPGDKVLVRAEVVDVSHPEQVLVEFFSKTDQWSGLVRNYLLTSGIVLDLDDRMRHDILEALRAVQVSPMFSRISVQVLQHLADQITAQTRPAIEEPKGLGAVVEDAEGDLWVRIYDDPAPWRWGASQASWGQLAATCNVVRVLSEGVKP